MILWKFKEKLETRGESYPCRAFRWVIETNAWKNGSRVGWSFGLVHQRQSRDSTEWRSSHTLAYEITIVNKLSWGSEHFWYDGPHCSFSIGPITFSWGDLPWGDHCRKCYNDD